MPTINYLTRINFDFGTIATLGAEIEALGLIRPLLVTDRGIADAAYSDLANSMGVVEGMALYDWMTDFVMGVVLPTTLSALDVDAALLPQIAEKAAADHLSATNPRPARAEDYLRLLRAAI